MHKLFSWIHRSEPAIETQVFVSRAEVLVEGRRAALLDFHNAQDGEPPPPPFSPYVRQALSRQGIQASLVAIPIPDALGAKLARDRYSESQRIHLALDHSDAAGAGLLVSGQLDALFRTASGGLTIKVSARIWDVKTRSQIWSGRLTANWIKRYPLEDCLLRAAIGLVAEWDRTAPAFDDLRGIEMKPEPASSTPPMDSPVPTVRDTQRAAAPSPRGESKSYAAPRDLNP